ncbi:MAG: T9SS type A sorting domain-containing protein [Bacteroidetes bacterium]|nr:T9SS type A sorting domain-containing protein [Bacteroidota bacterium]
MALHPAMSGTRSLFSNTVLQFSLFVFFVLFRFSMIAQNLVPNPSFEIFDTCPNAQGQIIHAIGWKNFNQYSPDYYNMCSTANNYLVSVPHNWTGYQQAASGNAYAGIYTYETPQPPADINIRECIGAQLLSPLVIGTKYFFSFKANLALDTNHILNQATNNIGMLFSTIFYSQSNPVPINNFAHVYSTAVITDTMNWTTIAGSFIADSAYKYVVIGNFFDNAHTTIIQMQDTIWDRIAYYFIDDVYVSTDSIAGGIAEQDMQGKIKIYPNPSDGGYNIRLNNFSVYSINVYNELGKLIFSLAENIGDNLFLDLRGEKNGIYFLLINDGQRVITKKLIKE